MGRAEVPPPSKPSLDVASTLLYKLHCQWPFAAEVASGKREELQRFISEVGEFRATKAVTAVIQEYKGEFCPPMGKIREYCPERPTSYGMSDDEHAKLSAERKLDPDSFFGTADVLCMMRILTNRKALGKPKLNSDQVLTVVLESRKRYRATR